ncbi:hypothetical protein [Rubinisphaera italica]|uniref:Uncharacterized protein n=1 Tax=Rubinisphaera italica TaxID=2527969 RepID=A0A5C5XBL1_9PLAN|nr:hypothetical protein [Rubinisphaera italica]TWT60557.1 hypothetical protein Pan54_12710 [Rubinisphaera italica]
MLLTRMFHKLHAILEKAFHRRKEELRLSVSDAEVVLFKNDTEVWRFRWDLVARIVTCKRDLFSMDLICLDFFMDSQQLNYSTHEEMQGFQDLSEQIRRLFPSIGEGWWSEVAFPAFATNQKILYDKLES